ncbi:MAG: stage III sporulation protein AA [Firmicutes bacterium]|nr:stage III sporulation protein AA [Bacillota bacterium]
MVKSVLKEVAPRLREVLAAIDNWEQVEEIRLRLNRPLVIKGRFGEYGINYFMQKCQVIDSYIVTNEDISRTIQIMSKNSWYALEEEVRSGYLTLENGHRVGIVGKVILEQGRIKNIKHVSGLNIRLAREIRGSANQIMRQLFLQGELLSTLIISPPGCGKTTLLRDIARQLSNQGFNVVIIDERSEIAACYHGCPQLDVGLRTDVLDGCPKAEGITMALRGMSPQLIITDEIGHPADGLALAEAMKSGVKVISSCHGDSLADVRQRQWVKECSSLFQQAIVLSRRNGPGTIEQVLKWK